MDNGASVNDLHRRLQESNDVGRKLAEANSQWQRHNQAQEEHIRQLQQQLSDLQLSQQPNGKDDVIRRLQQQLSEVQIAAAQPAGSPAEFSAECRQLRQRLEDSERARLSLEQQAEASRKSFESEIAMLKTQLQVCTEDCKSEKRRREELETRLQQSLTELSIAQRQLQHYNLQQMQNIQQRREAALEQHRREYERSHAHQPQVPFRRPIYQADGEDDGEDEID